MAVASVDDRKNVPTGGIVGGVVLARRVSTLSPQSDFLQFCLVTYLAAMSVSLLVFVAYQLIEKASLIMIGTFTLFTVASLVALQNTDFAITLNDFVSGLVPALPPKEVVLIAWAHLELLVSVETKSWHTTTGCWKRATQRMRDHGTILWEWEQRARVDSHHVS